MGSSTQGRQAYFRNYQTPKPVAVMAVEITNASATSCLSPALGA